MMRRHGQLLLGVILGALLVLLVQQGLERGGDGRRAPDSTARAPADDDDDDHTDDDGAAAGGTRLVVVDGRPRVLLSAAEQRLAGIEIATPVHEEIQPEERRRGVVADDAALREAQAALAAARAARAAQAATTAALAARVDHIRALPQETQLGVRRELLDLELSLRRERERAVTLGGEEERLARQLAARWGTALVELSAPRAELDAALATGQRVVVQFTAPGGTPPTTVYVAADGVRAQATAAPVIGRAPDVLPGLPGATWFAAAPGAGLRRGMAVDVWLPRATTPVVGLRLPRAALLWHGGRQWFYVQVEPGAFERRRLVALLVHGDTVIVPAPPEATVEPVVVAGGQSLLAEEFRGAIPDEDDD